MRDERTYRLLERFMREIGNNTIAQTISDLIDCDMAEYAEELDESARIMTGELRIWKRPNGGYSAN